MSATPDPRNPVVVRTGLDGSQVSLLVQAPRGRSWGLAAVGLVLAGLIAILNVWIGLGMAVVAIATLRSRQTLVPRVLQLEVDRSGVRLGGKLVHADCDYFGVTIDGVHHIVVGGLTKKEHAALRALFIRPDRGSEDDVPQQLEHLAQRRRDRS